MRAAGIVLDRPGVRIERLGEAITVLDGLFAEGPFSFDGEHYRISDLDLQPKPIQRPRPPLVLGGGGKRMLSVAARHADVVGVNANHYIAIAVGLACGYLGMVEGLKATDPITGSAYGSEFKLHWHIHSAIEALRDSNAMRSMLGDEFVTLTTMVGVGDQTPTVESAVGKGSRFTLWMPAGLEKEEREGWIG